MGVAARLFELMCSLAMGGLAYAEIFMHDDALRFLFKETPPATSSEHKARALRLCTQMLRFS